MAFLSSKLFDLKVVVNGNLIFDMCVILDLWFLQNKKWANYGHVGARYCGMNNTYEIYPPGLEILTRNIAYKKLRFFILQKKELKRIVIPHPLSSRICTNSLLKQKKSWSNSNSKKQDLVSLSLQNLINRSPLLYMKQIKTFFKENAKEDLKNTLFPTLCN